MHIGKRVGENCFMISENIREENTSPGGCKEKNFRVTLKKNFQWTEQCLRVIGRATGAMRKLNVSLKHVVIKVSKRIYPTNVRSHLESSVQACFPYFLGKY